MLSCDPPIYDLTSECGELHPTTTPPVDSHVTGRYVHVLLDWVQRWDQDTRELVIMESGKGTTISEKKCMRRGRGTFFFDPPPIQF
jgi:hypothetical protein